MMYLTNIEMIPATGENTILAVTLLYLEDKQLKFPLTDWLF